MACLKHQETQSVLQCQHDLEMMDHQMEVERILQLLIPHFFQVHIMAMTLLWVGMA